MSAGSVAASIWHRVSCCLAGHDYTITADGARMFVRCNRCGHASRGLEIDTDLFRKTHRGERTAAGGQAGAGHSTFATR